EGDSGSGESAEWVGAAGQTRVDHHCCLREPFLELMMVRDDELQTEPGRLRGLLQGADAAVDRDHHRGTGQGDLPKGLTVKSIALFEPMGYVKVSDGTE